MQFIGVAVISARVGFSIHPIFSGYYIYLHARSWLLLHAFDTSRFDPFTDVQWLLTARSWL